MHSWCTTDAEKQWKGRPRQVQPVSYKWMADDNLTGCFSQSQNRGQCFPNGIKSIYRYNKGSQPISNRAYPGIYSCCQNLVIIYTIALSQAQDIFLALPASPGCLRCEWRHISVIIKPGICYYLNLPAAPYLLAIAFEVPNGKGKGTFIWEPLSTWESIFDWKGKSNELILLYDELSKQFLPK